MGRGVRMCELHQAVLSAAMNLLGNSRQSWHVQAQKVLGLELHTCTCWGSWASFAHRAALSSVCALGLGAALGLFSPQRLGMLQSLRVISSQESSFSPQDSVSALLEQTAVELEAVEKKLEESRSTLTSGESW